MASCEADVSGSKVVVGLSKVMVALGLSQVSGRLGSPRLSSDDDGSGIEFPQGLRSVVNFLWTPSADRLHTCQG